MFVFGHIGITLGSALALRNVAQRPPDSKVPEADSADDTGDGENTVKGFLKSMDLRLLATGSLLPDIIDKPLGLSLLGKTIGSGRAFSHTLIFLILVAASGLMLYRRKHRTWLLTLASGTLSHLILDEMWLNPRTLFYPLFGGAFPRDEGGNYLPTLLKELTTRPATYIPEILGLLILLVFFIRLIKRKRLISFTVKDGQP